MIRLSQSLILILCFLCGCDKYYVTVKREAVDQSQLASTFVGSPDPRQKNPPLGQQLIIEWRLPREALKDKLTLVLSIVYRDHSQEKVLYPIEKRREVIIFPLLGDDYKTTEGFLTYKAEIVDEQGNVLKEWKQLLWTNLIEIN